MFNECIKVLKMLLGSNITLSNILSLVNFDGTYFKLNRCVFKKPIKKIPITIAANKNKMMKIAAHYADVWESSYLSPKQFCSLRSSFEVHLSDIKSVDNGDGTKIIKSIEFDVLIAETDGELEYKKRIFAMERGHAVCNLIINNGLVGKPDTVANKVKEYITAGIDQLFLAFQDLFDSKALELFMTSIKSCHMR
jgi:alkanesulfonate monooxygenase SsuD/methylene tetrahydromethanopterin reductase-like flavin-dependent oxidoreductase (luciferase family)